MRSTVAVNLRAHGYLSSSGVLRNPCNPNFTANIMIITVGVAKKVVTYTKKDGSELGDCTFLRLLQCLIICSLICSLSHDIVVDLLFFFCAALHLFENQILRKCRDREHGNDKVRKRGCT